MMSRIFIALLLAAAWIDGHAQSSLPPCPKWMFYDFQKDCIGTLWTGNPSSPKYVGGIRYAKMHGPGTMTYPNGEEYVGEWKNDKRDGRGTYIWPTGQRYEGEWKNDQRHGRGTLVFVGGDQYVGEWADDTFNGLGILYAQNGSVKGSGRWAGNLLTQSYVIDPSQFPFDARFAVVALDNTKKDGQMGGFIGPFKSLPDKLRNESVDGRLMQTPVTKVPDAGNSRADGDPLSYAKKQCKELGFKEKTEKFGDCVLDLSKRSGFQPESSGSNVARSDGSPDDKTCIGYGYAIGTTGYADCRLKLDQARQQYERELTAYEVEKAEYDRRAAAIKRENELRAAEALSQYGLCFASCGTDYLACATRCGSGSAGVDRSAGQPPVQPSGFSTLILNGKIINCSRLGSIVTCN